jgi:uncharacterized protein
MLKLIEYKMAKKKTTKKASGNTNEEKVLSILTHLLALFFSFLAPLIILLISEKEIVKKHSRRALNWQISLIIYLVVAGILSILVIGVPILIALYIANIVFCIVASIKASNNELWKYPLTIEFIKD